MIAHFGDLTGQIEKGIVWRVAQASGGLLQVPVITYITLAKSGSNLYFGDHVAFVADSEGNLKINSMPTFPSRDRLALAAEMMAESVPTGIRPYVRRKRQMYVPVAELLRHLCRCKPVLARCPWLPEQVEALRTLEAVA